MAVWMRVFLFIFYCSKGILQSVYSMSTCDPVVMWPHSYITIHHGGSVLDRSGEVVNAQIFSSSASTVITFVLGQFVIDWCKKVFNALLWCVSCLFQNAMWLVLLVICQKQKGGQCINIIWNSKQQKWHITGTVRDLSHGTLATG